LTITINIPKPSKGADNTIGLKEAAAALGLTRQVAFHMVRNGTFPVATSIVGANRVRVDVAALRKHLGMKPTATSIEVPEAVKRNRRASGAAERPADKATASKSTTARKGTAKATRTRS
jgi:hypothetical protein